MSVIHSVSAERRKAIVSRIYGGTTIVTAAELKSEAELAFAVRFLCDHFTYKRSKSGDVNASAVQSVVVAIDAALGNFVEEVAEPQGIDAYGAVVVEAEKPATPVVSKLGKGEIVNPYNFI